jgi:hypothetical protein
MDPGTDWVASGSGLALDLDGSNDRVDIVNLSKMGFGTSYASGISICCWINPLSLSGFRSILDTANRDVELFIGSKFGSLSRTQFTWSLLASEDFVVSQWQLLSFIHIGPSSRVAIWKNSTQIGQSNTNVSVNGFSETLELAGFSVNHGGTSFSGQLDDIRIYNRALTPSEIQLLYTGGRGVGLAQERIKHRRKTTAAAAFKAAWARRQQHIGSGVY